MSHRTTVIAALFLALGASTGCATEFIGDAKVRDGAAGCRGICEAQGLELQGMIFMGEYTNGCICVVPGGAISDAAAAAAGAAAGAVGVVMQTRRAVAQQQQSYRPR